MGCPAGRVLLPESLDGLGETEVTARRDREEGKQKVWGVLGREVSLPEEREIWQGQMSNGAELLSKAAGSWLGCRERTRGVRRQGARSELLGCDL